MAVSGKKVVFVEDSISRFLYHAFCRVIGISDAGAYNATGSVKHGNMSRDIGKSALNFLVGGFLVPS